MKRLRSHCSFLLEITEVPKVWVSSRGGDVLAVFVEYTELARGELVVSPDLGLAHCLSSHGSNTLHL